MPTFELLQKVYVVYEFVDNIDSIWTDPADANRRKQELDEENGPDYASITSMYLNTRRGFTP